GTSSASPRIGPRVAVVYARRRTAVDGRRRVPTTMATLETRTLGPSKARAAALALLCGLVAACGTWRAPPDIRDAWAPDAKAPPQVDKSWEPSEPADALR